MESLKLVRKYCIWCSKGQTNEVRLCPAENCIFHNMRMGVNRSNPRLSATKAIKKKCYDCSGYNHAEVTRCPHTDCALYPYRKGKKPTHSVIAQEVI
jgi:hypothetical protein